MKLEPNELTGVVGSSRHWDMSLKAFLVALLLCGLLPARAAELAPVVEVEEDIYTYTNANNGAGPMKSCCTIAPFISWE